ncbi:hypothetical protein [Candidatus Parabeggiatoa sp. HSG14]|uniref:effector-associated constant component EACC1 n=1 Tax=Candidatus Parabeggiatoa sp. HSG14 TaxID=3055593 RepID=UPI0025A8FEE3|nr:hypothetical protein [Thiotrichales bacterium HSG14]
MSIELELRLEGQDANEDTLLDLMDWLERANIDGLMVERKELPLTKGDMAGGLVDPSTLITVASSLIALADIAINVASWRKSQGEIVVEPTLKNPQVDENEAKIQAALAEIKGKAHRKK